MLQNVYNLSDLADLALKVPEVGAVNFNLLHTVLQTMISELRLGHIRPWCHVENPLLAKSALTKAKLREESQRRIHSEESLPAEKEVLRPLETAKPSRSDSMVAEEKVVDPQNQTPSSEEATSSSSAEGSSEKLESPEETVYDGDSPTNGPASTEKEPMAPKKGRREAAGWDEVSKELKTHRQSLHVEDPSSMKLRQVKEAWKYTHLHTRVQAAEEGLMRLTDIMDLITDKIKKGHAKPGAGPAIELEGIEERVEELEEARMVFDEDHVKLNDVERTQSEIVEGFKEIKALGGEIKDMKVEISSKADTKVMEEELAKKGDLELVLTKVDQLEFETAIEELGEAIGLLGLKFTRKKDEWEERALEIWKGIDSKMSRDVFDAAVVKIESRLTALMHGLKTIKKVVENLLYPDSSGVTRCFACRRPAGISGCDCVVVKSSPKRSMKSSGDSSDGSDVKERWMKEVDKAVAKRPKLDGPPYTAGRSTIISIPYSSATYRSSTDEPEQVERADIRMPTIYGEENKIERIIVDEKQSQIPKLPEISQKEDPALSKSTNKKRYIHFVVPKTNSRWRHKEPIFTNKLLQMAEREDPPIKLAVPKSACSPSRDRSQLPSSTERVKYSVKHVDSFAPIRLMPDPLRQEIIISPSEMKHPEPKLLLAPLNTDSVSDGNSSRSSVHGYSDDAK